jgi:hypothetical protein
MSVHPPLLSDGWELRPDLEDRRQRARKLVEREFGEVGLWGWKDLAICLTLAFWQTLLPHVRYVICIRNPLDAISMERGVVFVGARSIHMGSLPEVCFREDRRFSSNLYIL